MSILQRRSAHTKPRVFGEGLLEPDDAPARLEPTNASKPGQTCRLTLTINSADYRLRVIPCDPSAALLCIELRKQTQDKPVYHVSLHPHGAECTCADFVLVRDGRDPLGCKHCRALRAIGILPPVQPPTAKPVSRPPSPIFSRDTARRIAGTRIGCHHDSDD